MIGGMNQDKLLQATCEAIVTAVATALDAEPPGMAQLIKSTDGSMIGKRIMIDATDRAKDGMLNLCRLTILEPDSSPVHEVARIEYAHDEEGKFGKHQVYSVQSVRRNAVGELVLLENFLADDENHVRDADFQLIHSEEYAQKTVLATIKDWLTYREWQIKQIGVRRA